MRAVCLLFWCSQLANLRDSFRAPVTTVLPVVGHAQEMKKLKQARRGFQGWTSVSRISLLECLSASSTQPSYLQAVYPSSSLNFSEAIPSRKEATHPRFSIRKETLPASLSHATITNNLVSLIHITHTS